MSTQRREIQGFVQAKHGPVLARATVCSTHGLGARMELVHCTTTDDAGRFALEWRSGSFELLASSQGYQSRRQPVGSAGGATEGKLRIELEPASLVAKGRVVDGLGGPIIGAWVSARVGPEQSPEAAVLSGPNGDFALSFSGESAEVCGRADGYSFACIRALSASDGNRVVLLPASSIVGRVVMENGREPVSGAKVTLTSHALPRPITESTVTGSDGAFRIDELPAGSYEIVAVAERARTRQERLALGVGETSEPLILMATPAVELTAEVSVDGAPCSNGLLRLSGPTTVAGVVSSTGSVRLPGLLPGQYVSTAQCEGALPVTEPLDVRDQPLEHAWRLTAPPWVEAKSVEPVTASIVVLDVRPELGEPLQVFAEGPGRYTESARRIGQRFVFDQLPLGQYAVYANDRVEDAQPASLTQAGQIVNVELAVAAGASLAGVVLDEAGGPVADAWVTQTRADALAPRFSARVLTDAEGQFELSAAKGVLYTLSVTSPSGDTSVDAVEEGAEIVIRVARPASLSGSVVTSSHGSVPEFVVELSRAGGSEVREARGTQSRFYLSSVAPGAYELTVRSVLGSVTHQLTAHAGEAVAVELVLDAPPP